MARLGSSRRPDSNAASHGPLVQNPARPVPASPPAPHGLAERVLIMAFGVRQPIVAILLLISLFTVLSGKPLDGLLLVIVAMALAWEAGMHSRENAARALMPAAPAGSPAEEPDQQGAWR